MNIREKIAKILAKAKSTDSEAEAEMLLAKAAQMMEEHQIEAHELGDASDPIGMTAAGRFQAGPPSYKFEVMRSLARLYGCKTLRMYNPPELNAAKDGYKTQTWRIEITGPLSARVTTELMTDYVWEQLLALAKAQGKQFDIKPSIQLRKLVNALTGRIWGMVREAEKADKPRTVAATKNALVVKEATEAFYDQLYAEIKLTQGKAGKRSSNSAARAGAAGIGLHRQTGGSTTLRIGR